MKNKELIENLKEYDPDAEIELSIHDYREYPIMWISYEERLIDINKKEKIINLKG